jgi:hypothetical protein
MAAGDKRLSFKVSVLSMFKTLQHPKIPARISGHYIPHEHPILEREYTLLITLFTSMNRIEFCKSVLLSSIRL